MEKYKRFSTKKGESLRDIRLSQITHGFIIPSDYVYFLMNYNGFTFKKTPTVSLSGDYFEFDEFYDLETIIWELHHFRKLTITYNHTFWLDGHLSIGRADDHRIVLGITTDNMNEVFLYNDEECTISKISDDIYTFIDAYL